jgi:hypothetical protein
MAVLSNSCLLIRSSLDFKVAVSNNRNPPACSLIRNRCVGVTAGTFAGFRRFIFIETQRETHRSSG